MIESRIVAIETPPASTSLLSGFVRTGNFPSTPNDNVVRRKRPSSGSAKFTVKLSSGRTVLEADTCD